MKNGTANEAKADFSDVYTAPTPHAYIALMAKHGYEIGEQARPFCTAAAEMLSECNSDAWSVQMLDVGCSYGIGSAFVKYGCTFDEMVARLEQEKMAKYKWPERLEILDKLPEKAEEAPSAAPVTS